MDHQKSCNNHSRSADFDPGILPFCPIDHRQGMNTESMVGKESPLYQIYDHLYKENFGTESIAVLIEGDDVASVEVLKAASASPTSSRMFLE